MKNALLIGAVAAALTVGLSACGRQADLEPPRARETERAPRSAEGESLPEPATINRPSSEIPIDGGPSNPFTASGAAAGR